MISRPLALATLVLAACHPAPPEPPRLAPQVQHGPAANVRPARILVLHAVCGSVERRCPRSYVASVDAIVRGGLEFAGLHLVEAETLFAETRQRHEEHGSTTTTTDASSTTKIERRFGFDDHITTDSTQTTSTDTSRVVLDGPTFYDLSVDERRAVLAKSGADAVLSVRVVVGGQMGVWTPNQNVEVMVKLAVPTAHVPSPRGVAEPPKAEGRERAVGSKLGLADGDVMAWASRCTASSNQFATVEAALEHAARCAVFGGTGR